MQVGFVNTNNNNGETVPIKSRKKRKCLLDHIFLWVDEKRADAAMQLLQLLKIGFMFSTISGQEVAVELPY